MNSCILLFNRYNVSVLQDEKSLEVVGDDRWITSRMYLSETHLRAKSLLKIFKDDIPSTH